MTFLLGPSPVPAWNLDIRGAWRRMPPLLFGQPSRLRVAASSEHDKRETVAEYLRGAFWMLHLGIFFLFHHETVFAHKENRD
jgi:hypothetical protein